MGRGSKTVENHWSS